MKDLDPNLDLTHEEIWLQQVQSINIGFGCPLMALQPREALSLGGMSMVPQKGMCPPKNKYKTFFITRSSWADQMDEFDLKTSSSKADKTTDLNGDKSKAKKKREAKQRRRKAKQEVSKRKAKQDLRHGNYQ